MTEARTAAATGSGLHVVAREAPGATVRVLIIHGAMDRATSFAKLDRRLGELSVVRYDRRGYAGSLALGTAALAVHVTDALDVLAERPSVVVGHSIGGLIALGATERRPDLVQALVLYETPTPWVPWWPASSAGSAALEESDDPGAVAERFMRRMVGDRLWERLPPSTREKRRAEGPALLADLRSVRAGAPVDPTTITTPALVAHGTASDDRHQRAAKELAEALPNAVLEVIEGAQHGAHLTHPGPFADLVRQAASTVAP